MTAHLGGRAASRTSHDSVSHCEPFHGPSQALCCRIVVTLPGPSPLLPLFIYLTTMQLFPLSLHQSYSSLYSYLCSDVCCHRFQWTRVGVVTVGKGFIHIFTKLKRRKGREGDRERGGGGETEREIGGEGQRHKESERERG